MLTCGNVRRLNSRWRLCCSDLTVIDTDLQSADHWKGTSGVRILGADHPLRLFVKLHCLLNTSFHSNPHQRICFRRLPYVQYYTIQINLFFQRVYQHHSYQNTISWQNQISGIRGNATSVKFILFAHSVYHWTALYHTDPYLVYCWYTSKLISAQAWGIMKMA